ncbi:hypothetical protein M9458_052125 [Cirrhinus mrigala]|uniref:Uncharacterized protein n=1 Tax=Cirrhinus mrigala TaxID=683832 RepID=A0ABD0MQT9_CIRMR
MGKVRGFYRAADWSRGQIQSARWILGDVVRGVVQESECVEKVRATSGGERSAEHRPDS